MYQNKLTYARILENELATMNVHNYWMGSSTGNWDELLVMGNDIKDLKRPKGPLKAMQSLYALLNKVMPTLIHLWQADPTDLETHQ